MVEEKLTRIPMAHTAHYNLPEDPGERHDLAAQRPSIAKRLNTSERKSSQPNARASRYTTTLIQK